MNILLVIPSLAIGGAEVFVVRLANSLSKSHNVYILDIFPKYRSPDLMHRIDPEVNILTFKERLTFFEKIFWKVNYLMFNPFPLLKPNTSNRRFLTKIRKIGNFINQIVSTYNIDVINSHLLYADWITYHYFKRHKNNAKFIISMHGCYNRKERETSPNLIRIKKFDQSVFSSADHIILLTSKNSEPLKDFKLKNAFSYIPLGFDIPVPPIDTLNTKVSSSNTFVFILVSRAIERKGWIEAIHATINIYMSGIPIHLILVGGSEYQQKLQEQYSQYSFLQFVGTSSSVLSWVSQSNVGLFPSYIESESYPNTVIEYLVCNKPVIGTDIGDVRNMLSTEDGELAGQLLKYSPNGTSIDELQTCMLLYMTNQNLLSAHTHNAKLASKKFDMHSCAGKYLKVYLGEY